VVQLKIVEDVQPLSIIRFGKIIQRTMMMLQGKENKSYSIFPNFIT